LHTAGVGIAALVVALTLAWVAPPKPYPAEGVRPLVAALERRVRPGDAVISPSSTSYAFALYTHWPVSTRRSDRYLTGFAPVIHHPGVTIIDSHFEIGWSDKAAGGLDPRPWPAALDRAALDRGVAGHRRVWLLAAVDPGLEGELGRLGFRRLATVSRPGTYSRLTEWQLSGD
jgi:hypothetical protein